MQEEYKHPIHLICDHCKQIVQCGLANVSQHSIDYTVYTEEELFVYGTNEPIGMKARYRPTPSYTPVYETDIAGHDVKS